MAKLIGDLKLTGSVGDLSFIKTKNGIICRRKPVRPKSYFKNSPTYEGVRRAAEEFGRAGKAVKFIRKTFQQHIEVAKDAQLTPRLQKLMLTIIKTDPVNDPGQRNPQSGNLRMLDGFEFNNAAGISKSIPIAIDTEIDRATGKAYFSIPAFVPGYLLGRPGGSTHYRLVTA